MSLFTRAGTYYVRFTGPDGREVKRSAGTSDKKKAQEYHDRLKVELWNAVKLKQKPRRTWDEAALKWLEERAQDKRTIVRDKATIRWFQPYLTGRYLDEITREFMDDLMSRKLKHVSSRTKDLYVALVRAILRRAMREWEWIDRVPAFRIYQGEPVERGRDLTSEEASRFITALPPYLKRPTVFALATGLRKGNVCGLLWRQVDWERKLIVIERGKMKNKRQLTIPLNEVAMRCLEEARGEHPEYVFTFRGQPLRNANTKLWRRVAAEAGLDGLRFHDLRHTWASWLGQEGVSDLALMRLAGWQTMAMAKRYTHFRVDHLRPYADQVCPKIVLTDFSTGSGGSE